MTRIFVINTIMSPLWIFLCKSSFGSVWIFVVSGKENVPHQLVLSVFSKDTQKMQNIHPIKIAYLVQIIIIV